MATDALLFYNVGNYAHLGLAVPNPGKGSAAGKTQNINIAYLASVMGRNLQAIMFHPDTQLAVPPSINTLTRIHKLCVRARDILHSRSIPPGEFQMETAHAVPAPEEFLFYPTPYFNCRNPWLKEYAYYILTALTEAMQHQERAKPLEITDGFSKMIGQFVQRVYQRVAIELLHIPREEAIKGGFTLTEEMLKSYDPTKWFTSTELNDTIEGFERMTTEDDREPLTRGIPYSHLPQLGPYPLSSMPSSGLQGNVQAQPSSAAGSSFAGPPTV